MNLDPQFDRRTSVLDVNRKANKIWAQAYGKAIAEGKSDDEAMSDAEDERVAFLAQWWGDE